MSFIQYIPIEITTLLAATAMSTMSILNRQGLQTGSPYMSAVIINATVLTVYFGICTYLGVRWMELPRVAVGWFLLGGIFSPALSMTLFYISLNRIGVGNGLGEGRRGVGSEPTATRVWGLARDDYIRRADPWPLNPEGELLLGLKIESKAALPHIEEILAVPDIGFAEMGPGDLSMSLGYLRVPDPWSAQMLETHDRVRDACAANGVAFLSSAKPNNVVEKIDGGARVIAGGSEETARIGRAHTQRSLP